jgi:integrase/recombinase XerD
MPYNGCMFKRTQTKLTIYRRHAPVTCAVTSPRILDQCDCPLWVHGKVNGKFMRQSLDTRSLATAMRKRDEKLNGRGGDDPTPGGIHVVGGAAPKGDETIEYAGAEFLKACETNTSTNTQILYARAVHHFSEFAAAQGLTLLREIETAHIRAYFEANRKWKRSSKQTRLIHLRVWFNYCSKTRRWIAFPPTQDRTLNHGAKGGQTSTRKPFAPAEITRILAAVEEMPADVRDMARALVLLLLYTGMRISDATFFEREYLTPRSTADYYVIKTRRIIALPPEVQQPAVDALNALPASRVYFFQADADDNYREARQALRDGEEFSKLMPQYTQRVADATKLVLKVLEIAGLDGACHRFRDTFAINLLTQGADIFTVSQMLGHSDVRITQKHYLKLIPGYRERMSQSTRVLSYAFPAAS